MTRKRKWLIASIGGALLLGIALVTSGLIPIGATSGHFAVTEWFLKFAMRRSVATHARLVDGPLDHGVGDPSSLRLGAATYEHLCSWCHSKPGRAGSPRSAFILTPMPPDLRPVVGELKAEELYYVIKNGVKMTGMPGWSSQARGDEIWPLVGFLAALPSMSEERYQDLLASEIGETPSAQEPPLAVSTSCLHCHGLDGKGRGIKSMPRIDGQARDYLAASLRAYAQGTRESGIMGSIASRLSETEIDRLADYYASIERDQSASAGSASSARASAGQRLAEEGQPSREIASCIDCHSAEAKSVSGAYPILWGQRPSYLRRQLELFDSGERGGGPHKEVMHKALGRGLSEEQRQDAAGFYGGTGP